MFCRVKRLFHGLGLDKRIEQKLIEKYGNAVDIQKKAIPVLVKGHDAIITSETGSGKTIAYLAPLLSVLRKREEREIQVRKEHEKMARLSPRALVLVPSRELAVQVLGVLVDLIGKSDVSVGILPPPTTLSHYKVPDIAVSWPTALADFVKIKKPKAGKIMTHLLHKTQMVVVDEADHVLSEPLNVSLITHKAFRGIENQKDQETGKMKRIVVQPRQFVFVGATLPAVASFESRKNPRSIIEYYFPGTVKVSSVGVHAVPLTLEETFVRLHSSFDQTEASESTATNVTESTAKEDFEESLNLKYEALFLVLDKLSSQANEKRLLVFTNSSKCCKSVHENLKQQLDPEMYQVDCVQGGMDFDEKRRVLKEYMTPMDDDKMSKTKILVCTDVVARGIDFCVSTVVHFDFPKTASVYLHRVGRAARIGRSGKSIAFILPSDESLASMIEQASNGQATGDGTRYDAMRRQELGLDSLDTDGPSPIMPSTDTSRKHPLTALLGRKNK